MYMQFHHSLRIVGFSPGPTMNPKQVELNVRCAGRPEHPSSPTRTIQNRYTRQMTLLHLTLYANWLGTFRLEQLQFMKLLANSYVFISEDNAKLYVAEKCDDHDSAKTAASSGRSPEPFPGAGFRASGALEHGCSFACRCSPAGLF